MKNLTNINTIKELLEKYGFKFSKSLGQNFLINPSVCPKIAELGKAEEGYGILEIGTGFGTLTAELAKRADKVTAVEIDSRLLPVLEETLSDFNNINVINDDIMKVNIKELIATEFSGMKKAVCANLPYYITSPVIMYLLESEIDVDAITVMVQKEAAQRLCAEVGTREAGAITAAVRYYGEAEMLFQVSRGSFMPAPNVDSAVIQIRPADTIKQLVEDKDIFFKVIKSGFSQRRKTMANSLSSLLGISKENLYNIFDEMGITRTVRIEQLSIEQLAEFSNILKSLM
jgi:16S rRNA (adenine1518-N6/adenine1519-N6)-dimethyltransferase